MEILYEFGDRVLHLLPTSPFKPYIDYLASIPFLGYLNWFVPVGDMLVIASAWLGVIVIFNLYSIILRWIRAIN